MEQPTQKDIDVEETRQLLRTDPSGPQTVKPELLSQRLANPVDSAARPVTATKARR